MKQFQQGSSFVRALRGLVRQSIESFQEWRYGIYTETNLGLRERGITDPNCHHYAATSYIRFREIMKRVPLRPGQDVFVDIGSGLGRVVVMAASYPFRKVIGVEISEEFDTIARQNIEKARRLLRCKDLELQCIDARKFVVPPDLSVVYFWSPFNETILSDVFANLRRSLEENPREMTIIYTCPPDHKQCLEKMRHELGWLTTEEDTALSSHMSLVLFKYSPIAAAQPVAREEGPRKASFLWAWAGSIGPETWELSSIASGVVGYV